MAESSIMDNFALAQQPCVEGVTEAMLSRLLLFYFILNDFYQLVRCIYIVAFILFILFIFL